jgi:hypothetical protein
MTLAGLSRFIIADITKPSSVTQEIRATVPNYMIPLVPIIEEGEKPYSMFADIRRKYDKWVLKPLKYKSGDLLIEKFEKAIVNPALEVSARLIKEKSANLADDLRTLEDY